MAPLIVLVIVTVLALVFALLSGRSAEAWPEALAVGLAAMFFVTSSAHLMPRRRAGLIAIVPPGIPAPAVVVSITGALEAVGAVALLVPPTVLAWPRPAAAWALAALLVLMFPANVYASRARRHPDAPHTPLPLRIALQVVFVAAAVVVALTAGAA